MSASGQRHDTQLQIGRRKCCSYQATGVNGCKWEHTLSFWEDVDPPLCKADALDPCNFSSNNSNLVASGKENRRVSTPWEPVDVPGLASAYRQKQQLQNLGSDGLAGVGYRAATGGKSHPTCLALASLQSLFAAIAISLQLHAV